jgi:DNA repair protein RadC
MKEKTYYIAEKVVGFKTTRRHRYPGPVPKEAIKSPEQAMELVKTLMAPMFKDAPYEEFWSIALNSAHAILGIYRVSNGTVDQAQVSMRKVIKFLLDMNAVATIVCHQHPGGNLEFSWQDRQLTKDLKEMLDKAVDIQLIDHLLFAGDKSVSMKEVGLLP